MKERQKEKMMEGIKNKKQKTERKKQYRKS
jgi:hypothetical protein